MSVISQKAIIRQLPTIPLLQIDIITIFPNMFDGVFADSIIKRAVQKDLVKINVHDLRSWTEDSRKTVDDKPYGGGPGMIMMVEPFYKAIREIRMHKFPDTNIILTSAKGKRYTQENAQQFSKCKQLIILCGRYEGIDERVSKNLADTRVSVGEAVYTGGEIPAMAITDSVTRLIPGVLGNSDSLSQESFSAEIKQEYPQYTRPAEFHTQEGDIWKVPDVLLSGDHAKIEKWRNQKTS